MGRGKASKGLRKTQRQMARGKIHGTTFESVAKGHRVTKGDVDKRRKKNIHTALTTKPTVNGMENARKDWLSRSQQQRSEIMGESISGGGEHTEEGVGNLYNFGVEPRAGDIISVNGKEGFIMGDDIIFDNGESMKLSEIEGVAATAVSGYNYEGGSLKPDNMPARYRNRPIV